MRKNRRETREDRGKAEAELGSSSLSPDSMEWTFRRRKTEKDATRRYREKKGFQ